MTRPACLLLAVLLAATSWAANAGEPPSAGADRARIGDHAGAGSAGRIAINQAAGSGNAQANLAALALADRGLAGVGALQSAGVAAGARDRLASARIDGAAFAGTRGLLSMNQVAGSGNAQANLFATGPQAAVATLAVLADLDDAALAGVAGDAAAPAAAGAPARVREAHIADGAFRGSQGVVQVNQTAGVGNVSTNAIVLQLPTAP